MWRVFLRSCQLQILKVFGGFDHRAHAVPGVDKTDFDLDNNGYETILLNGIGSHSRYYNAGSPVVSGVIEKFAWRDVAANRVFCIQMECDESFPVGETQVSLTVVDNTENETMDTTIVTVLLRNAVNEAPRIDSVSPNQAAELEEIL